MSREKIKANAQLVVDQLAASSGLEFGYNAESVAYVDNFIENQRIRPDIDENMVKGLVNTLGSFLGECVISCYGGDWENKNGEWCVSFDINNAVYPFNKVRKQFLNGQGDSVKAFFEAIPAVFKDCVKIPVEPDAFNKQRLEQFIRQAEDAYGRIYEEYSSSDRAAAYNECKESMASAIQLARQMGLEDTVRELEEKREHYKNVFRDQMGF